MSAILQNLYEKSTIKDFSLITGRQGLNKTVRWIHMVENKEIASFLTGNEVVFLTGVSLSENEKLLDLVKLFYEKNVSGIVINIGPYIDKIDENVISFCDECNIPLFSVPWHVHMADIMREFAVILCQDSEDSQSISNAFKTAIINPDKTEEYVRTLSNLDKISYQVVLIKAHIKREYELTELNKSIENIKSQNLNIITCTHVNEHICILFSEITTSTLRAIIVECQNTIAKLRIKNSDIHIGIGTKIYDIDQIATSYKQAYGSCQIAISQNKEMVFYEQIGLYKLILSVEDKEILREFYTEYIKPLEDFDKLKDGMLIEILSCYIENNGSVNNVSQICNLHRNTVIYKLKKIEELLDCNLSEWKTRSILDTALKIYKLINI